MACNSSDKIIISVIIILAIAYYFYINKEDFALYPPLWNYPTRHTRNMSYDLRGDVPIWPYYIGPWLQSPRLNYYNYPYSNYRRWLWW